MGKWHVWKRTYANIWTEIFKVRAGEVYIYIYEANIVAGRGNSEVGSPKATHTEAVRSALLTVARPWRVK